MDDKTRYEKEEACIRAWLDALARADAPALDHLCRGDSSYTLTQARAMFAAVLDGACEIRFDSEGPLTRSYRLLANGVCVGVVKIAYSLNDGRYYVFSARSE